MKNALVLQKAAREVIMNLETNEGERVQRMIQYCTEEMHLVESELAAGIATIEHQRNVLEAIFQMTGKALGKF